ncbi:MAG: hypothetical protein V1872_00025 [bacterium]
MTKRHRTKMLHEGEYVAEIEIEIIDTGDGWSPYISLEDALKLDEIREALRKGDIPRANKIARVYKLTPVAA